MAPIEQVVSSWRLLDGWLGILLQPRPWHLLDGWLGILLQPRSWRLLDGCNLDYGPSWTGGKVYSCRLDHGAS
ncbi:hypothetical protein MAR_030590 [Mya arenaria]|uniref:Uncharacterized protein n=1 Tax=Mya arenaria TaxID=6604 RepID=A0ABY7F5B7_MYAAR|nr:hypothetical protein MAR_030590 [Mya arenaria]